MFGKDFSRFLFGKFSSKKAASSFRLDPYQAMDAGPSHGY